MSQQRHSNLQCMSHTGSVHLREDIANEVSLHVQVLHPRQRVLYRAFISMDTHNFHRMVSLKAAIERSTEQTLAHSVLHDGNAMKVAFHGITGKRFERGFRAQDLWRPV